MATIALPVGVAGRLAGAAGVHKAPNRDLHLFIVRPAAEARSA